MVLLKNCFILSFLIFVIMTFAHFNHFFQEQLVLHLLCILSIQLYMSHGMRFPTMRYVRQQSLRSACAYAQSDQSLLLVACIFYECLATD